ncbi:MAG: 50S ribosomal protein L11 methyltransferase, partial [Gammaproteobacteria bacterium]
KNHVQDRLHIGGPELLRNTQQQYDVLIANILAQPLLSLRQHFAHLLKPQGIWAISGLLHEQADAIEHAYREHLQPTARTQHEDWILIAGKQIHSNHS